MSRDVRLPGYGAMGQEIAVGTADTGCAARGKFVADLTPRCRGGLPPCELRGRGRRGGGR